MANNAAARFALLVIFKTTKDKNIATLTRMPTLIAFSIVTAVEAVFNKRIFTARRKFPT